MVEERPIGAGELGEGSPTGEMHKPSAAELRARGRRNIAIALAVVAFVLLVFATTILRLSQNLPQGAGL